MTATTTDGRPSFAQLLRERSWEFHRRAEGAGFTKALMNGKIDRTGYALMVAQHYAIYEALEAVARDLRNNPVAAPFITDRLTRLPSLAADLDVVQPGWRAGISPLPATLRYVTRIQEMLAWPAGFVAHHYTRYLGDLSGGLAIGKVVSRAYDLDGPGASFYRFEQIDRPKAFKDEYRARLDTLCADSHEQELVVGEVLTAYQLNTDVFADLGRAVGLDPQN